MTMTMIWCDHMTFELAWNSVNIMSADGGPYYIN